MDSPRGESSPRQQKKNSKKVNKSNDEKNPRGEKADRRKKLKAQKKIAGLTDDFPDIESEELESPLIVINTALELALLGEVEVMSYLSSPETMADLQASAENHLVGSLQACFTRRQSPRNVRAMMLWRFACSASRVIAHQAERSLLLRLAVAALDIILDYCRRNAELRLQHANHYAALLNSRQQLYLLSEESRLRQASLTASTFGHHPRLAWDYLPAPDPENNESSNSFDPASADAGPNHSRHALQPFHSDPEVDVHRLVLMRLSGVQASNISCDVCSEPLEVPHTVYACRRCNTHLHIACCLKRQELADAKAQQLAELESKKKETKFSFSRSTTLLLSSLNSFRAPSPRGGAGDRNKNSSISSPDSAMGRRLMVMFQ
jgi:hypothetical protein